ncbi:hypothetical protein ACHAQA_004390 [Verticillium albo-atrum]
MKPITVASILAVALKALASQSDVEKAVPLEVDPANPCPTKIDVDIIPFASRRDNAWSARTVHNALQMCPSIDELSFRYGYMGCGHEAYPERWRLPLDMGGNDRYPSSPKVLDLEGYDFDRREWDVVQPPPVWASPGYYEGIEWSPAEYRTTPSLFDGLYHAGSVIQSWAYWVNEGQAWKWIRALGLSDGDKAKTNLDLWLDAMDFSNVQTLTLRSGSKNETDDTFYRRLPASLPSLRSLSIDGTWRARCCDHLYMKYAGPPPAREFILALPPASLDNLTWTNGGSTDSAVFDKVLEHHGPSLKHLEWHSEELAFWNRSTLTADQLLDLAGWAPNLQSLTVDLDRNGIWPVEELHALAGMPKLTDLTVYFKMSSDCGWMMDVGDPEDDHCAKGLNRFSRPLLNSTTATEMYDLIQGIRDGGDMPKIVFKSGDWSPPQVSGWSYSRKWFAGKQAIIECSNLKDDGTPKGRDDKICTGFDTDPSMDGLRKEVDWTWDDSPDWEVVRVNLDEQGVSKMHDLRI